MVGSVGTVGNGATVGGAAAVSVFPPAAHAIKSHKAIDVKPSHTKNFTRLPSTDQIVGNAIPRIKLSTTL
jgi:hypothetical protein